MRKIIEKRKMERGVVELVDTQTLVPQEHLLRKVDKAVEFRKLYELMEPLYSEKDGRPSIDPVVLFKIVLLQHLDGISCCFPPVCIFYALRPVWTFPRQAAFRQAEARSLCSGPVVQQGIIQQARRPARSAIGPPSAPGTAGGSRKTPRPSTPPAHTRPPPP